MRGLPRIAALLAACTMTGFAFAQAQTTQQPANAAPQGLAATSQPAAAPQGDPVEQWIQQTKNPVPWLKWGADERLRNEYSNNAKTLNNESPKHEYNYQRYRTRVWTTVTPIENIEVNARLTWEWRNYCLPKGLGDVDLNEAIFDTLNVKWSNILGQPLSATVGRQELNFGNGWLIREGTPKDGSRTYYFDAALFTYEHKPSKTTVDAVYVDQAAREDRWIEPFNHREFLTAESGGKIVSSANDQIEQDERGAILYVTNKAIERTQIDGYFIYKHDGRVLPSGDEGDIYAFGARGTRDLDDHWKARGEFVKELGHKNGDALCALGFNSQLGYFVKDKLNNNFRLSYEFLSGDDPHTKTNEAFDPLWGRWSQWSELMSNVFAMENNGRAYYWTNMHRLAMGWSFNPNSVLEMCTDYHLLFADENTNAGSSSFSESGKFRGQLVTWLLKYKFSEHVSGQLLGEFFFPGDYYSDLRNDPAVFLRYELVFTW